MDDTIVAISTGLAKGAISIIRMSGKEAIKIANSFFVGKDLEKVKSHTINYGHIIYKDKIIDEVLVSIMRGPKTYTTEDIVEINSHGGISTTQKILDICLKQGARLAEVGEFTKRAYLNGRIDLIEAESINDLINAKTEFSRNVAIKGLSGKVSEIIKKFRDKLINILAQIEVNIDYPEYKDIEETTIDDIKKEIVSMNQTLKDIVKLSKEGLVLKNGIKTAIIGRPNVGKSSILNKLLEVEKAIVTDIPGTTRDIVEGEINLGGVILNLIDTAGIRDTKDVIEKQGVLKSYEVLEEADLILLVLNNNEELTSADLDLIDKTKNKKRIIIINKDDLKEKINKNKINEKHIINLNTIDNEKIEILKKEILKIFKVGEIVENNQLFLNNTRQINLAEEALEELNNLKIAIEREVPIDLLAIHIKEINEKLGEITGEVENNEVMNRIFERFCVGK